MSESTDPNEHPEIVSRNARYGLQLFAIYVAMYGGFMFLAVFKPEVMAQPAIDGVNVAIVYGFTLIVAAFVLAMIYTVLCRSTSKR